MKLLKDIYAYREHVENHQKVTNGTCQSMDQSLELLYQGEKDIQTSDQLMVSRICFKFIKNASLACCLGARVSVLFENTF